MRFISHKSLAFLSIASLLIAMIGTSCKTDTEGAAAYFDQVHLKVMEVIEMGYRFEKAVYADNLQETQDIYDALISTTDAHRSALEELGAFGSDNSLRKAAIDLLDFQADFFKSRFADALKLYLEANGDSEQLNKAFGIIDEYYAAERQPNEDYEAQARAFSKKYQLNKRKGANGIQSADEDEME